MEQLRIRAGWFRKQERLQDKDWEEIIKDIKTGYEVIGNNKNSAEVMVKDEHRRVLEAVEEGLLQVHGMAPNTKQQGIFRILGENCNDLNNKKQRGNMKIWKALDIKDDLDTDCLMYCKHCLNFKHKDNKMT